MFNPSPQQLEIRRVIEHENYSIIIVAVAGSGKTTTIVWVTEVVPKNLLSIFLAFNKSAATQLATKLPQHIQGKTFHSHCLQALTRHLPKRPRIEANKVRDILKDETSWKEYDRYGNFVPRLIGLAKNAGIGTDILADTESEWFNLIDYYNLVLDNANATEEEAIKLARHILSVNNDDLSVIDFDDMLYQAARKNVTFDKNNFVFLDEAQDTNAIQRYLLKGMLADSGRLIAVGDGSQAIYGFRGADADALEVLGTEFNCHELPLSVSYRCAQEVVKEARKYVTHIESHPENPVGMVENLQQYQESNFSSDQVILCRNTAPLVGMAFAFIKRGRGVRILGREIGQGLIQIVKKMNTTNLDDMLTKLEVYRRREYDKAIRKGHDAAAETLNDRVACIGIFVEQLDEDSRTVNALTTRIESLFNDQSNGGLLTLCSVHKAKGLEWDTVNILDFETYMPSKYAKQPWQQKQEQNLIYVAITRARLNLRYIYSGGWKKESQQALPEDEQDDDITAKRREALESL